MGAPKGNNNPGKGKPWADALRWVVENETFTGIKQGLALREIAKKVVNKAIDGDGSAITEIGNRLDGKPHQSMDVGHYDVPAEELTDDELIRIAATGSASTARKTASKAKPTKVH